MNFQRLLCAIQSSPLWTSPRPAAWESAAATLGDSVDVSWYWRRYRAAHGRSFGLAECVGDYLEHAAAHYLSPNLAFDEFWYRHQHPDVDALVKGGRYRCGWEHYLAEGADQGYSPVFWFDERWYCRQNSEIAVASGNGSLSPFEHYLLYGIGQDLAPSLYFNASWYRERYMQDLEGERPSYPILHYLLQDPKRRVCPVPFFDPAWYAEQYAASLVNGDSDGQPVGAYEHYLLFGRRLGYSPSPYFNEAAYREIPRVQAKLTTGAYASGFEHFVAEGPANGFRAKTHLLHSGIDYTSPEYLKSYERSLLLHLTQLRKLSELAEQ